MNKSSGDDCWYSQVIASSYDQEYLYKYVAELYINIQCKNFILQLCDIVNLLVSHDLFMLICLYIAVCMRD